MKMIVNPTGLRYTMSLQVYGAPEIIMDSRPIGIFDSGLGGLTALRALRRFLPEENIVYFADSVCCPFFL